jgi:hypothetical protein
MIYTFLRILLGFVNLGLGLFFILFVPVMNRLNFWVIGIIMALSGFLFLRKEF